MPQPVGLTELFVRLGRINVARRMVEEAERYVSEHSWRTRIQDSPHGQTWHTSMHASSFPGDDPRACARFLAYEMMGFAESELLPMRVSAAGAVGMAIEDWVVRMLGFDGRVLSATADAKHQIGFEDADHWLTGSPDLIVLPKFWNRPYAYEIKGEKIERVKEMQAARRTAWPKHGRQLRAYLGMGHSISQQLWPAAVVCRHTWRLAEPGNEPVIDAMICRDHGVNADSGCLIEIELQPLRDGEVLYCARDDPEVQASWYYEHDEEWFRKGVSVLRRVQEHYATDKIPAHPFGGKQWSVKPCEYCNHKKNTCKPDQLAGVTKLTESHGVDWSRGVFGHYDPDRVRAAVLERWKGREGMSYTLPPGYTIGRTGVQKERANV